MAGTATDLRLRDGGQQSIPCLRIGHISRQGQRWTEFARLEVRVDLNPDIARSLGGGVRRPDKTVKTESVDKIDNFRYRYGS